MLKLIFTNQKIAKLANTLETLKKKKIEPTIAMIGFNGMRERVSKGKRHALDTSSRDMEIHMVSQLVPIGLKMKIEM